MAVPTKKSIHLSPREERVHLVTLGCPKNQVDSENIYASIQQEGFLFVQDPKQADVILINTCGFIQKAVEESLDTLLELSRNKISGRCRYLLLAGCMAQRYGHKLLDMLPEVDIMIGPRLVEATGLILASYIEGKTLKKAFLEPAEFYSLTNRPLIAQSRKSPGVWAYIKVSEGCSNHCSYCTIPSIRGALQSRPEKAVLGEARMLASQGTLEVNLIAQDLAAYGQDKGHGKRISLSKLLRKLAGIESLRWIRLLYCHPAHIDKDVIELFGEEEKLCHYLDLPIQHVSQPILQAMNRLYSEAELRRLIEKLRSICPDIALRTTIMVGFPGETERHFEQLLTFLKDIGFNHVGTFCYSPEEGTPASLRKDVLPEAEKMSRYHAVMALQTEISKNINQELVGTIQEVLVEGHHEETPLILKARTMYQAPEVDGIVCINKGYIPGPGMARVRVTDAHIYDLVGEIVSG